jgi:hypothetical protein
LGFTFAVKISDAKKERKKSDGNYQRLQVFFFFNGSPADFKSYLKELLQT